MFATDGVLERVWYDTDGDGLFEMYGTDANGDFDDTVDEFDEMGLARWDQYDDTIYTNRDFSCENAGRSGDGTAGTGDPVYYDGSSYLQNNCLEKGDFLVIPSFPTNVVNKDTLGNHLQVAALDAAELYGDTQTRALATLNSAGMYEIMKISVEEWTMST